MSGGGCLVGEAQAAKHPEVSVVRWSTQEPLEWYHWRRGVAWAPVEKVSGSGERFSPKGKWHASVQKKAANTIIQGADDVFYLAVSEQRYMDRKGERRCCARRSADEQQCCQTLCRCRFEKK